MFVNGRFWLPDHVAFIKGFAVVGMVLLAAFVWILYLRRLVRLVRRREEAERALGNQLEFMRALIDGTPHPIYVRDCQGRMMICTSGYLEVLAHRRRDLLKLSSFNAWFAQVSTFSCLRVSAARFFRHGDAHTNMPNAVLELVHCTPPVSD